MMNKVYRKFLYKKTMRFIFPIICIYRWSNFTHGLHSKVNCLWIVEDLSTLDLLLRKERG